MKFFKTLLLALIATSSLLFSQNDKLDRPEKYRLGIDLGLNYNFAALGYQTFVPVGTHFHTFTANDGTGIGGYLGLRAEYLSNTWWGVGLQLGYDNRGSLVTDESLDNKPEFDIYNSYLNIAPYFKFNELLFKNSSVYIGPVIGLKMAGEYDYDSKLAGTTPLMAVEATELKDLTLGAQVGFNFDIRVAPIGPSQVFVLSPFI